MTFVAKISEVLTRLHPSGKNASAQKVSEILPSVVTSEIKVAAQKSKISTLPEDAFKSDPRKSWTDRNEREFFERLAG